MIKRIFEKLCLLIVIMVLGLIGQFCIYNKAYADVSTYVPTSGDTSLEAVYNTDVGSDPPAGVNTVNTAFAAGDYATITANDGSSFTINGGNWQTEAIQMNIIIAESAADITSIDVPFSGFVGTAGSVNTYIWNFNTTSWQAFDTNPTTVAATDGDYTFSYTTADFSPFVDTVEPGRVHVVVVYPQTQNNDFDVDDIRLVVNWTPPCTDPDPSTLSIPGGQTANGDNYDVSGMYSTTGDVGALEHRVSYFSAGSGTNTYIPASGNASLQAVYNTNVGSDPPAAVNTVNTAFTPGDYATITANDGSAFTINGGNWETEAIQLNIVISEAAGDITSMDVSFSGWVGTADNANTYIWNFNTTSWQAFDTNPTTVAATDGDYTFSYTTADFSPFVDTVEPGRVHVVVVYPATGNNDFDVDDISLKVNWSGMVETVCTDWTTTSIIPTTTAGGSTCGNYADGGTYTLDVRGTDPDCGDLITTTATDFTWNSCTDTDLATLTTTAPLSSSTVNGTYTVQTQVGTEGTPSSMTGMTVTISGSAGGVCDVTDAAMTWNSSTSRWEYDWNTSACGTAVAESGITIDVSGTDPDCNTPVSAAQITNITIDNTCSDPDLATFTITAPRSSTFVMGTKIIQMEVGTEPDVPGSISNVQVTVSGSSACDVAGAAMTWNATTSRYEYSWNTSACGTVTPEPGITIDVSGQDTDCPKIVNAAQITNIEIDNTPADYAIANCGSCHKFPPVDGSARNAPAGAVVGSHDTHVNQLGLTCISCHVDNTGNFAHRNNIIRLTNKATGYSNGTTITQHTVTNPSPGRCQNINCHGARSPQWGDNSGTNNNCSVCHGMAADGSDGRDTNGDTGNTDAQVGAHVRHLTTTNIRAPLDCSECHNQPSGATYADKVLEGTGHNDSALPPEVPINGTLARTGGLTPQYNNPAAGQCSNTWCHGSGLIGGDQQPTWNVPMLTGVASNDCTKCHGYPPDISSYSPSHTGLDPAVAGTCEVCHEHVNNANAGFDNISLHINGGIDGICTGCHGDAQYDLYSTRQVTGAGGDFVRLSRHVNNGTTTEIVTAFDCVVCHAEGSADTAGPGQKWIDLTKHKNGTTNTGDPATDRVVKLRNVDNYTQSYNYSKNVLKKGIASAAEKETMRTDMDTFCLNCHDTDGASGIAVVGTGTGVTTSPTAAEATHPFNDNDNLRNGRDGFTTRTRVIDVKSQFYGGTGGFGPGYNGNPSQHAVLQRRYSSINANWASSNWTNHTYRSGQVANTARETATLHCSDCHLNEQNAHGAQNAWHMLQNSVVDDTTTDFAMTNAAFTSNAIVCWKCHNSNVYDPGSGVTTARISHNEDGNWGNSYGNTGGNDGAGLGPACLLCHGGDGFGHIHGRGSATDGDDGTYTPPGGSGTYNKYRFMPGAEMWWQPGTGGTDADWNSTTSGSCYFAASSNWSSCTRHDGGSRTGINVNYARPVKY